MCTDASVYVTYHEIFYSLEAVGVLDPDSDIDLFVLHSLYKPLINQLKLCYAQK